MQLGSMSLGLQLAHVDTSSYLAHQASYTVQAMPGSLKTHEAPQAWILPCFETHFIHTAPDPTSTFGPSSKHHRAGFYLQIQV